MSKKEGSGGELERLAAKNKILTVAMYDDHFQHYKTQQLTAKNNSGECNIFSIRS
ncbi:MAG: hypothetical protein R6V27_13045 [Balneolaceae bacterium]